MKKYRWIYIVSLLAAVVGYLATDRRQMLLIVFCLIGILALSLVCWLFSFMHLQYELEIDDVSICGQDIAMKIVLKYPNIVLSGPILVQMTYENLIFADHQTQEILLHPGNKKRMEYLLPYVSENCGKTRVRIQNIKIYDMLGILYHEEKKEKQKEIIIYPNVRELQIVKSNRANSKNIGESYDEFKKGNDLSQVFDMRDYHEGDNIKRIHWKLSSKMDRLIVREFGNPINYQTALFYDTGMSEELSPDKRRKAQNAVLKMTASLSKSLIQTGFMHHLITVENFKEVATPVQDNNDFLQMLSEMMSRKIPETLEESIAQIEILIQDTRFTNLIFVCCEVNMDYVKQLSRQVNLTVVYVNNSGSDSVENGDNCLIISIPADKIDEKVQMIEF